MIELKNIGPKSAAWLAEVGIASATDLRQIGPVVAYARVRERQPQVSLNLLWALEAGLRDCHWQELSDADKRRLRKQLERLTGGC